MTTMETFTVGETAEQTGFSVDTLRYYEREGLLDPVRRIGRWRAALLADRHRLAQPAFLPTRHWHADR